MGTEGKKVLIVDDEADALAFVQAALQDGGYEFITATDGEEALEKAKAEAPDIAILDVQMPKKDGFHVFAELRENDATKAMPVIMLTAIAERSGIEFGSRDMGEYFGSEPDAYIEKPIDPVKLSETVSGLLSAKA